MTQMQFETFDQVVKYMESFTAKVTDRDSHIRRMKAIMQALDNPQNSYKTIHLAGSKGKGSTAAFLANSIEALGYKTGLYMSPHVSDYRERFTNSGKFFPDNLMIAVGNKLKEGIDKLDFSPRTFELYTAFAFLLFKEAGCTWAVIETGLGGRLDATNILNPQAVVLTPIELEHTEILGDTIEKIAVEKSKIIKPDTPVFISYQQPQAMDVFLKEASENNSPVYTLKDMVLSLEEQTNTDFESVKLHIGDIYTEYRLRMLGKVQAFNSALAILTLAKLGLYRKGITEKALEDTIIPGRLEKIKKERMFFIDGAHTKESIKNLMISFRQMYPSKEGVCIFGCVADKKFEWMSREILDCFDTIIVSKPGSFKKSNPQALFDYMVSVKNNNQKVLLKENTADAIQEAINLSQAEQPILVCGSFYLAGAVKEALCL